MSKRSEFVGSVLAKLVNELPEDTIGIVEQALNEIVTDYEVEMRCTDIVPSDDFIPKYYGIFLARKKIAGRSMGTLKIYNYYIMDFFLHKPAPIEEMDGNLMAMYLYDFQRRHKISNRTLDQCRIILNTFFQWATNEGYIEKNFVGNIDPIKYVQKPREPLSDDEAVILRNACETYRERAVIDLFLSTGVRVSELANIKWEDIDMQNRTITIFGKGGKYRTVIFNSAAKISLLEYKLVTGGKNPYVFIAEKYPYKKLNKEGIELIVKRISDRSDLTRNVTPHILRHTFATSALQRGMPIEQLKTLLGHVNYSTTLIYAKIDTTQTAYEYRKCFGA